MKRFALIPALLLVIACGAPKVASTGPAKVDIPAYDGVPFKNGYRRFKIKHGQGNNDYLSIQEVVTRRYREPGQGHELFPDVILIDGGLGQLHAAMDAFKLMDVKPPMVISLAKKEELIYTQAKSEPIKLPRNHLGLKMLQYLRDEAHRFAQHYHHILRRKAQLEEDVKAGKRPPALMMSLHVWSLARGTASLFARGDAGRRSLPMSAEELLESAMLIYLQGLGFPSKA